MPFSHWGRCCYVAHVPGNNLPTTQGQEPLIKFNVSHSEIRHEVFAEKKGFHQEGERERGEKDENDLKSFIQMEVVKQ